MRRFPDPNRRYLWTANATVHSGARLRYQQVNAVDRIRTELFCTEGGGRVDKRFLLLSDVAEVLNISAAQAYALVRSGELPAIKVGGRGQWRGGGAGGGRATPKAPNPPPGLSPTPPPRGG